MTTAADPLNTSPWTPVVHDWGEGEGVNVIPPGEVEEHREDLIREPAVDKPGPVSHETHTAPARLVAPRKTPAQRHTEDMDDLRMTLDLALDQLDGERGARAWARSINYYPEVIDQIDRAIAGVREALTLIDIHEG